MKLQAKDRTEYEAPRFLEEAVATEHGFAGSFGEANKPGGIVSEDGRYSYDL